MVELQELPETAMHAVLECPAWTVIRAEHIGAAIGDIRERFGVLQEALGDTVLGARCQIT